MRVLYVKRKESTTRDNPPPPVSSRPSLPGQPIQFSRTIPRPPTIATSNCAERKNVRHDPPAMFCFVFSCPSCLNSSHQPDLSKPGTQRIASAQRSRDSEGNTHTDTDAAKIKSTRFLYYPPLRTTGVRFFFPSSHQPDLSNPRPQRCDMFFCVTAVQVDDDPSPPYSTLFLSYPLDT